MKQTKKEPLSRLWFMSRGYRKHPSYNLWAREGEAQFLSAYGTPLKHGHSPFDRAKQATRGYVAPSMPHFDNKKCHILMGEIFYGERPVFIDEHGKPYFGYCHHLIEDPLDYRPENLLCWLTRKEHTEADRRRRILESLYGDLHQIDIAKLQWLQDPRQVDREYFDTFTLHQMPNYNVSGDVFAGE
jgi:hypothetical protein